MYTLAETRSGLKYAQKGEIIPGTVAINRGIAGERIALDTGKESVVFLAGQRELAGKEVMYPEAELVALTDLAFRDVPDGSASVGMVVHALRSRVDYARGLGWQAFADQRVAFGLDTIIGKMHGTNDENDMPVEIPFHQGEIGDFFGVSREVTNRILRRLADRQILESTAPITVAPQRRRLLQHITVQPLRQ